MTLHHAPPSIRFPVGGLAWVSWVLLAWWLLSISVLAYACSHWPDPVRWLGLVLSVLGPSVLALWAGWGWRARDRGDWVWDGTQWGFQSSAPESSWVGMVSLDVVLDLQHSLLLRGLPEYAPPRLGLQPTKNIRWGLVSRTDAPHLWHDFRCAVYSRASRFC